MPPKSITKNSKNPKKRKNEDTTSHCTIDSLFKKTVPMQVDQPPPPPPTLGTLQKQYIVPKMTIINIQTSFYIQSWQTHKNLILDIFSKSTTHTNYATATRLCENTCRYGNAQKLYNDLKLIIEEHANKIKKIYFQSVANFYLEN
ncbi:unnamed protein product [Rhizopus stolonifer]